MTGEPSGAAPVTGSDHSAITQDAIPDIELLARFVLFDAHIRASGEVKPDAFIPHPYAELSVTRHATLSSAELWTRGEAVATQRGRPLRARADVSAGAVRATGLEVQSDPVPENPEHALILGWPSGKPAQKIQAQLLAKLAATCRPPS